MRIVIQKSDLKRETYRASGPGGQHRNKTDSAVRLTYLPIGIVAACCEGRCQHANEEAALRLLVKKIAAKYQQEKEDRSRGRYEAKASAAFGSQIRSYILHGQQRVVDHRTGLSHPNPKAVLDGDLDRFLAAASPPLRA